MSEEFFRKFRDYCKTPGVDSGKASSYAKAIEYLCDFLKISVIDEQSIALIRQSEKAIYDRNSALYQRLLEFLSNQGRKSYLVDGYIRAALKPFFEFVEKTRVAGAKHALGSFDSWEIVDEKIAIKHCDKK